MVQSVFDPVTLDQLRAFVTVVEEHFYAIVLTLDHSAKWNRHGASPGSIK